MTGNENALSQLLAEKSVLLADGATGTTLFEMGLVSGEAPEFWNVDHPDRIRQLHRRFVEAGADVILTNSFGGTRQRLALHNAQNRVHELNEAAARLAREVADESPRKVIVAGSVGPTGELFEPLGKMTHEEAVSAFSEQMQGLKDGGADIVWIETMSAAEEIGAAAEAASALDMPYVFTASFDTAGRTMMGVTPADIHAIAGRLEQKPVALGANCGVGASDLLASVLDITGADPNAVVVAKANCGIPVVKGDTVEYSGTPDLMANYTELAIDSGARIIGGCCGTTHEHLARMRRAIDEHVSGTRPDLETIAERIGPMVNSPARPDARPPAAREGRRRRRA